MRPAPFPVAADLLGRAAMGDQSAQSALVEHALAAVREGRVTAEHGVGVAELCARLAATRGDVAARSVLAGVLFYVAQINSQAATDNAAAAESADCEQVAQTWRDAAAYRKGAADAHIAEAVAIMDELANEGNEAAAEFVNHAAEFLPPELLDAARQFSRFWDEPELDEAA